MTWHGLPYLVFALLLSLTQIPPAAAGDAVNDPPGHWKNVATWSGLQRNHVVMQHWDLSCGAAAVATILTYRYHDIVSEQTVVATIMKSLSPEVVQKQGGFSLLDLKRYVTGRGYEAAGYRDVTLDELATMVPAIVPLDAGDAKHFVVLRGFSGNRAIIADPAQGNRTIKTSIFLELWQGHIAFVIRSTERKNAPNDLAAEDSQLIFPSAQEIRAALESNMLRSSVLISNMTTILK